MYSLNSRLIMYTKYINCVEGDVNFKLLSVLGLSSVFFHGCMSIDKIDTAAVQGFSSPQELLAAKKVNGRNGKGEDYVYYWGSGTDDTHDPESLYPHRYLTRYCESKSGKFERLYKSEQDLTGRSYGDFWQKHKNVTQGIGGFKCTQANGQKWFASIEPVGHRFMDSRQYDIRYVKLLTEILPEQELKKKYKDEESFKAIVRDVTDNKVSAADMEKMLNSPNLQQVKLYFEANKQYVNGDHLAACNKVEKAYQFGNFYPKGGSNAYTESAFLFARCLGTVPAFARRYDEPSRLSYRIVKELAEKHKFKEAQDFLRKAGIQ